MNFQNPAECLKDELLADGWRVQSPIQKVAGATGGSFSVSYKAINEESKREAYLKALNYASAFQSPDFPSAMQGLTAAYVFERDILLKCGKHGMRRVMTPIAHGTHKLTSCAPPLNFVDYLIFDLADGDIRKCLSEMMAFDVAWCLRSMHHAVTGVRQLHFKGIAHQDLKPSNVLSIGSSGCKVADLGRAFDPDTDASHDAYPIAGDPAYAPPEQLYSKTAPAGTEQRKAADVYALGSLLFFHFCSTSATQGLFAALKLLNAPLSGDFQQDLPLLRQGFETALAQLSDQANSICPGLADAIIGIAREMCDPDPEQRGDPIARTPGRIGSHYSVERYVSKFNLLAKKAEFGLL